MHHPDGSTDISYVRLHPDLGNPSPFEYIGETTLPTDGQTVSADSEKQETKQEQEKLCQS